MFSFSGGGGGGAWLDARVAVIAPALLAWSDAAVSDVAWKVGVALIGGVTTLNLLLSMSLRTYVLALLVVGVRVLYFLRMLERVAPPIAQHLDWRYAIPPILARTMAALESGCVAASAAHDIVGVTGASGIAFVVVVAIIYRNWVVTALPARLLLFPVSSAVRWCAAVLALMWRGGWWTEGEVGTGGDAFLALLLVYYLATSHSSPRGGAVARGTEVIGVELGVVVCCFMTAGFGRASLAIALATVPAIVNVCYFFVRLDSAEEEAAPDAAEARGRGGRGRGR